MKIQRLKEFTEKERQKIIDSKCNFCIRSPHCLNKGSALCEPDPDHIISHKIEEHEKDDFIIAYGIDTLVMTYKLVGYKNSESGSMPSDLGNYLNHAQKEARKQKIHVEVFGKIFEISNV